MTPPSLADVRKALAESDAACFHLVERLRDCLSSGYVLLSKEDREAALEYQASGTHSDRFAGGMDSLP